MVHLVWLRPFFFWAFIPVILIAWMLWKKSQKGQNWHRICDEKLLQFFAQKQLNRSWIWTWIGLILSLSLFIIALAGPSLSQRLIQTGKIEQAQVIVLDLSPAVLQDDVSPNRLERAKLMIQDLLATHQDVQWGFLVFSSMPFVVTPMTGDIYHILNFLPILKPDVLPVGGYQVKKAIQRAEGLLKQAHYPSGKILVFSSQAPPHDYSKWVDKNIELAWINLNPNAEVNAKVRILSIKNALGPLNHWISAKSFSWNKTILTPEKMNQPHDLGRYFLLIGMLVFVMLFRKGWFLRLWV